MSEVLIIPTESLHDEYINHHLQIPPATIASSTTANDDVTIQGVRIRFNSTALYNLLNNIQLLRSDPHNVYWNQITASHIHWINRQQQDKSFLIALLFLSHCKQTIQNIEKLLQVSLDFVDQIHLQYILESIQIHMLWYDADDELKSKLNLYLIHTWCNINHVGFIQKLTLLNHAVQQASYDTETSIQKIYILLEFGAAIDVEKSCMNNCSTVAYRYYTIPSEMNEHIALLFLGNQLELRSYIKFHEICEIMSNNTPMAHNQIQKIKQAIETYQIDINQQKSIENKNILQFCQSQRILKILLRNNLQLSSYDLQQCSQHLPDKIISYLITRGYDMDAIIQGLSSQQLALKQDLLKKASQIFQHNLLVYIQQYMVTIPDDVLKFMIPYIGHFILPNELKN